MYNISDVSEVIFRGLLEYYTDDTQLHWSTPFCGNCESTGKQCRFKNNGTNNETECFEIPKQPENDNGMRFSVFYIFLHCRLGLSALPFIPPCIKNCFLDFVGI